MVTIDAVSDPVVVDTTELIVSVGLGESLARSGIGARTVARLTAFDLAQRGGCDGGVLAVRSALPRLDSLRAPGPEVAIVGPALPRKDGRCRRRPVERDTRTEGAPHPGIVAACWWDTGPDGLERVRATADAVGPRSYEPDRDARRRDGGGVKVREVIHRLEREGWRLDRQAGGHGQYRRPERPGTVTVPGNLGDDLAPGTLGSIRRQAGWRDR